MTQHYWIKKIGEFPWQNNASRNFHAEAHLFNFKFTCGAFMTLGKTNICRQSGAVRNARVYFPLIVSSCWSRKRLTVANESLSKSSANTRLTSGLDGWRLVPEMCVCIPFISPLEVEQMSRQMAVLARISPEYNFSTLLTSSTFIYFS